MKYPTHDIAEYVIALVDEFAKCYGMSDLEAFRYMCRYGGIVLAVEHYGIIHTLSFDDAVEYVALVCQRNGGELEPRPANSNTK